MKVFPVVHITESPEQAIEQAGIALQAGADGVYLIDHFDGGYKPDYLFRTFNGITAAHDGAFVGVNMLGVAPLAAVKSLEGAVNEGTLNRLPDGLWSDDAKWEDRPGEVLRYKQARGLERLSYLGGAAFKYTPEATENPQRAAYFAKEAKPRVDEIVTSGHGTGHAPTVAKIKAMKAAVGGRLAVASGITPENIADYAGLVDDLLVATSVETERGSGIFDRARLQAIINKAHVL